MKLRFLLLLILLTFSGCIQTLRENVYSSCEDQPAFTKNECYKQKALFRAAVGDEEGAIEYCSKIRPGTWTYPFRFMTSAVTAIEAIVKTFFVALKRFVQTEGRSFLPEIEELTDVNLAKLDPSAFDVYECYIESARLLAKVDRGKAVDMCNSIPEPDNQLLSPYQTAFIASLREDCKKEVEMNIAFYENMKHAFTDFLLGR